MAGRAGKHRCLSLRTQQLETLRSSAYGIIVLMHRAGPLVVLLPLCGLLLAGCGATALSVSTGLVVTDAVSITALHHDVFDILISGATGQDCSVVRLDRGKSYCKPLDPPSLPPPYCTQTLGFAQCWASPLMFPDPPRGLADGPWALTPEQDAYRQFPLFPASR